MAWPPLRYRAPQMFIMPYLGCSLLKSMQLLQLCNCKAGILTSRLLGIKLLKNAHQQHAK